MLELVLRVDFWIYVTMGIIFTSGLFLCIFPILRNREALEDARKALGIRGADGRYHYMSEDFLRRKSLNPVWKRFLSNLELMKKNNAACEIYDFINPQTMIHEPGHSAFGEMVPGMLTTLGIIGSFYGIVRGLSSLDLSTTETMSFSIAVLISGMRTAFNTSIVGAVLALVFQLIRRMTIRHAESTLRKFIDDCRTEIMQQLTPDATMMQTLHAILTELRRISDRLPR
ncbi:MAG: MotA/TolQ/ExbB proton channel family protein [Eubacteriales bacterium]|nr:MotA/TolQ/ExbB proton channel family protein [Eubacteriales bacterium]